MTEAITGSNRKVWFNFIEDCEDNEGGYFVMVYPSPDEMSCDYFDYFCVHPEDCDCRDWDAVENYCKEYISTITEY